MHVHAGDRRLCVYALHRLGEAGIPVQNITGSTA